MTRSTTKKTAAKKTAAKKATSSSERVCAYGDERPAVAVRDTPRGERALCEIHARRTRDLGIEVRDL